MRKDQDTAIEVLMEQLIETGAQDMAEVFAGLFNLTSTSSEDDPEESLSLKI